VLRQLPNTVDPRLLVGIDTADDAGVFQLDEQTVLIQTVDFFTPLIDDPYLFGQIAAANSLSDVYAMGGEPLTAMNIVAFPISTLGGEILAQILLGGQAKITEAGAVLVGGHTIADQELKYGLSITGIGHPAKIWTNARACVGDSLVLTKALGTGILATAGKADLFAGGVEAAIASMITLNKVAAQVAANYEIHACTDITGFGLLGHLFEMTNASRVQTQVDHRALPLLPEVLEAAAMGLVPAGAYATREYLQLVGFDSNVPENFRDVCYDPQTSGGLLFSLPAGQAAALVGNLHQAGVGKAVVIGEISSQGKGEIHVY
jgi:selenide,water dikinase